MKKIISNHYLISFYIITLIFSFLLLLLHFVFESVGRYSVSFTQLSPLLAVLVIFLVVKDKKIFLNIKNNFYIDNTFFKWIIWVIAIPGIGIVLSGLIMTYFKIEFVPWEGDLLFYIISFIAILIGSTAEEVAWRGFLLPNLQKKHTPFISSIIVGILWGVWHFNFTGGILGFILYTVTIIEISILMTWVFNKSNGNLLLMCIWHLTFNLFSHIFLWERFGLELFIIEIIVFGLICLLVLLIDRKSIFNNRLHKLDNVN